MEQRGPHEGGGRAQGGRRTPTLMGPMELHRPISFAYIYSYTLKTSGGSHKTTFPPPQPSVPVRSHLGAFFGDLPEGESIMEGFYINTITSPMKHESLPQSFGSIVIS